MGPLGCTERQLAARPNPKWEPVTWLDPGGKKGGEKEAGSRKTQTLQLHHARSNMEKKDWNLFQELRTMHVFVRHTSSHNNPTSRRREKRRPRDVRHTEGFRQTCQPDTQT